MHSYQLYVGIMVFLCLCRQISAEFKLDKYLTIGEAEKRSQELAQTYPDLIRFGSIGKSVKGHNLYYLEVTSNVNEESPGRPNIKFIGNVHGNEGADHPILHYLAQHLARSYPSDPEIKTILDENRLFILPSINPDGFMLAREGKCLPGDPGMTNANDVEIFNNFPDRTDTKDTILKKVFEPETMAVIKWMQEVKFMLSISFHTGGEYVEYPFVGRLDDKKREEALTPDDAFFKIMSKWYARAHPTMIDNNECGLDSKYDEATVNGAALWNLPGSMPDYNYVFGDCFEVLVYITCCKYPLAKDLQTIWDNHKISIFKFFQLAKRGVRGFVRDSVTGEGLEGATVQVMEIKKSLSSGKHGDYFRPLQPGTFHIKLHKHGYTPSDEFEIVVGENEPYYLDVNLTKGGLKVNSSELVEDYSVSIHQNNFIFLLSIVLCISFMFDLFNIGAL